MRDSQTFAAHAARCHQEAEDAELTLVRDRALRAEAAWTMLAQRSLRAETSREAREARQLHEASPEVFAAPEAG